MVALSRRFVLMAEDNIKKFKDCPIIMLEHNNECYSVGTRYRCNKCGQMIKVALTGSSPLCPEIVSCAACNDKKNMAHVNLYLN
jgi:hypothetical protein